MDICFLEFLPFIHPRDADALSQTSKTYHEIVTSAYQRWGRDLVCTNGAWHANLCKRARESIDSTHPNWRPMALASLVDRECIVCRKKYMARASTWGFQAHKECIRGMLLNVYYIPQKFGLGATEISTLPQERLVGYRVVSHETYAYDVVFKHPYRGMVPVEWTLQYVVEEIHWAKVKSFHTRNRQKAARALHQSLLARRKKALVEQRRMEALVKRKQSLENHPLYHRFCAVSSAIGHKIDFVGDFFDVKIHPTTKLKHVLEKTQKAWTLLQRLHPDDVMDVDTDVHTHARWHVARKIDEMAYRVAVFAGVF